MTDFTKYIGIPFEYGGRDRNKLDCYGLVMLLYKELHNLEIPDVISPTFLKEIQDLIQAEKYKWQECELEESCVILFNVRGYGCHVGYYLGNDKMIHTWEGTGGVTIERLAFSWKNRIIGTYKWNPTLL
jgi:cell wall-associated NlpC family hydrolase